MTAFRRQFGAVIVGGGPAGLAVLLAAHKDGRLTQLLQSGLLIVEQSSHIGKGLIGDYFINSDSTGDTFLDPLRFGSEASLHQILETPVARRIATAGANTIPLCDAGELLDLIGQAFHTIIKDSSQSAVLTRCTAKCARIQPDGSWLLMATDAKGRQVSIRTRSLILATGATQPEARLQQERVAGVSVTERWGARVMQSGDVVKIGGLAEVAARLKGKANPRVAILGGSTSAVSVAYTLLNRLPQVRFNVGGLTLFHRRPLRVYYTSAEEALADGYTEFGPNDLCPVTKRVFRLAGLRLESRELLMQLRGIGGRPPEPRMTLHMLKAQDPEAVRLIDSADLVVAALGYRPNALRILDEHGLETRLFAQTSPSAPMVDDRCRVMDSDGRLIPGLFGIGLAAGFVPHSKLGGEPSFIGQANGLWLWQNDIGSMIVDAVVPPASIEPESSRMAREPAHNHLAHSPTGQRIALASGTGV